MDQAWLQQRPHLASLVRTLAAELTLADQQYKQGRASGDAVDYAEFEERVAHATAKVEQDVHQVALSGLDVDVPFIRVWGKHYRRVHRIERTYGSLSGPVVVERTLYCELGQRQGPVLDPIAVRWRRRWKLVAEDCSSDRPPHVAGDIARSRSHGTRADATTVLAQQHRACRARGRR